MGFVNHPDFQKLISDIKQAVEDNKYIKESVDKILKNQEEILKSINKPAKVKPFPKEA